MDDLNPVDNYLHGSWEALGNAAPALVALAQLCSEAWARQRPEPDYEALPLEAQTILYAARERGIIEVRPVNSAFDTAARLLAVYVELGDDRTVAFRDPGDPEFTIRCLDGFRILCSHGLIIHHIFRDFSLSPVGIKLAGEIRSPQIEDLLSRATEFGLHD